MNPSRNGFKGFDLHRLPWAFVRDRRGATMVEFALVGVPFCALLGAIFELAMINLSMQGLQSAVTAAARQMMTGQVQANSVNVTNASQFNTTYVCPNLPSYMSCGNLITDIRTTNSFAAADTSKSFYTGVPQYCPGPAGSIVVIRVVYPLPSIFPLSLPNRYVGLSNNVPNITGWVHVLMGTAVIQEEPFSTNFTAGPSC